MKKRLLSILLCCVMLVGLLPTAAFAADTSKTIQLGTGSITGYADTKSYDYIYFGNWEAPDKYTTSGPIKWRVLDDQTNTGESGLFLLSDGLFGTEYWGNIYFDKWRDNPNSQWQFSSAQKWCQDFAGVTGADTNVTDAFTTGELTAILATTKSDAAYDSEVGLFSVSANILSGDKVFFLSAEEAENADYGFTSKEARKALYGRDFGCWWLRSPYADGADPKKFAGGVHYWGDMTFRYVQKSGGPIWAARPAFNLDSSAILFTSAAEGGKSASGMDSGLTAVNDYNGSEWKLTLKDSSRSGFSAVQTSQGGSTVTVSYSGAVTGENEYISAMVTSGDIVKYYGRIAAVSQASGTVTINLPVDFSAANGDKLYIFNEQYHGDKQTDYASSLVEVEVAAPHEHIWPSDWSYDDTYHWRACTVTGCHTTLGKAAHNWGGDGRCTECGRPKGHAHCICGGDAAVGDHTTHTEQTFLPWSGGDAGYKNGVACVYLEQDITLNSNLEVAGGNTLYLCLHGNTITSNGTNKIVVKEGSRLVICDCSGGGVIKGATKGWGGTGIYVYQSTLDIFGGKITGGKVSSGGGGGAIALDDKQCVLNIYGGELSGNNGRNSGGAIFLNNNDGCGTVNLYGGKICNNTAKNGGAIYAANGGTINLIGGEISGNTSTNDGGAVYAGNGASIKITGTKLTENKARWGGAIILIKNCSLVMENGEMSKNEATEGGAVSVFDIGSTFTLVNGSITGNSATDGGAVYLNQDNSIFNMGGGTISGNTATQHGGAVYANRDVSVMTMSGGTIENNTAGENGGAVYINKGQLNLMDAPVIRNNTVSGKANNVYLKNDKMLTAYHFKSTEKIGVTTETLPTEGNPVVFCNDSDKDYSAYFFADDANAHVEYNSSKQLQLAAGAPLAHEHVWSSEWTSDDTHHWHKCTADGCDITDNAQKDGYAAHSGTDDDNCTTAVTCECGHVITEAKSDHSYPDTWTAVRPGTSHIRKCQNEGCGMIKTGNCTSDGTATCQTFAKCTVCGGDVGTKADHSFTAEKAEEQYQKSAATCTKKAVYYKSCAVCGLSSEGMTGEATFESGTVDASKHTGTLGDSWKYDTANHWKEYPCCGAKAEEAAHSYNNATDTICSTCPYERTITPVTYNTVIFDANGGSGAMGAVTVESGSYTLPECIFTAPAGKQFAGWATTADGEVISGTTIEVTDNITLYAIWEAIPHTHVFDQKISNENTLKTPADCLQDEVYFLSCTCGAVSDTETFTMTGTALGHAWPGEDIWNRDETNHWHECGHCHAKKDEAPHDFGEDDICDTCSYDKSVPHTHGLTFVPENAATCAKDGNRAYYTCTCGKWFADAEGTDEITDKTSVIIRAAGHTPSGWKSDETGHWKECTVSGCGAIIEKATHTAGDWIIDKAATETAAGVKHRECTVCRRTLETVEIPKLEHTHVYGDWKSDENGHWKECTVSGCTDKTQAENHTFKWVIDKAATAARKGSKHQECTTCGYQKAAVDIPATRPANPTKPVEDKPTTSPKTGDSSTIGLWSVTLCGSLAACLALTAAQRRRKKEQ